MWIIAGIVAAVAVLWWAIKYHSDKIVGAFNWIKDVLIGFWNWLVGLPEMFYNAGKEIVNGLIEGIKSMAGPLADGLSFILNGMRKMLPSSDPKEGPLKELTRHGKQFMRTLAYGMQLESGAVRQALSGALGGLTVAPAIAAGAGQGLYGGYSTGGAGQVSTTTVSMGDINYNIDTRAYEKDILKATRATLGEMLREIVGDSDSGEIA